MNRVVNDSRKFDGMCNGIVKKMSCNSHPPSSQAVGRVRWREVTESGRYL
jgi:hypothetical protein